MCGIYGAIGKGWNQGTIRALTWANRERGTDSLGFFDSSGRMIKAACDPDVALSKENISHWLNKSENGNEKCESSWFIAGHTRLATRGKVNRQNSHPFRYGKIIGCHNGMIDAPKGYAVDSQYLFDALNKAEGDYNKAWGDITGYWGVAWFDGTSFYLQVHNGELSIGRSPDGCWYYSSNRAHLASCIGYNVTIKTLTEGQTLCFILKDRVIVMKEAKMFISTAPEYWARKYGCSNSNEWNGYYRRHDKNKSYYEDDNNHSFNSGVRDYDAEWRNAWEEYTSQSEHFVTD